MKQTVIGVYDSYTDAYAAQRALTEAGLGQADVSIYSTSARMPAERGPRVYAPGSSNANHDRAVLEQLEQLFSRLFRPGEYPPEAEDYREFIRRGGALVSASVYEVQVDLACELMRRAGAADVEERARRWRDTPLAAADVARGHLSVEEGTAAYRAGRAGRTDSPREAAPGAGQVSTPYDTAPAATRNRTQHDVWSATGTSTPGAARSTSSTGTGAQRFAPASAGAQTAGDMRPASTRTYAPATIPAEPAHPSQTLSGERARLSAEEGVDARYGPASVRGDEAQAPDVWSSRRTRDSSRADAPVPGPGTPLERDTVFDDEFRSDFDTNYANSGASYEDYQRAYSHGATLGQDVQYRGHDWQQVEPLARENWESRYPDSAWERFKAAVRHGWERVTGA